VPCLARHPSYNQSGMTGLQLLSMSICASCISVAPPLPGTPTGHGMVPSS